MSPGCGRARAGVALAVRAAHAVRGARAGARQRIDDPRSIHRQERDRARRDGHGLRRARQIARPRRRAQATSRGLRSRDGEARTRSGPRDRPAATPRQSRWRSSRTRTSSTCSRSRASTIGCSSRWSTSAAPRCAVGSRHGRGAGARSWRSSSTPGAGLRRHTRPGWSIATSSRRTCSSARMAGRASAISGSPGPITRRCPRISSSSRPRRR